MELKWNSPTLSVLIDMLGIILCMHSGNERWRYTVTPSLIGWAHMQNDPCVLFLSRAVVDQ